MKNIISASILNSDFGNLESEIHKAEKAGVDWIHLDIMDGHFVPNISFGPHIVSICRKITNLPLDVHLMISDPDKFIEQFADAGANYISVHVENNPHIHRTLQKISLLGKHPGIVLNPGTPIESIFELLECIDFVLLMTVNPGFGGQTFIPESLNKIKRFAKIISDKNLDIPIEVDGGINETTATQARSAGANILVAGSFIFRNKLGISKAVKLLKSG